MSKIKILNKGLLTSIQDLGRTGYQKYGVPVSGVMDEYSHKIANLLVGNVVEEATLEVTMMGPKILFMNQQDIAITGGDLQPKINNQSIDMWQKISVAKGDVLSFSGIRDGLRVYIAFAGSIDIDSPMGSKSYYKRADIGTEISNEQIININSSNNTSSAVLDKKNIPKFKKKITCSVILGPQVDYFSDEAIETFFESEYKVSNASDRMGYRLIGEEVKHKKTPDIISDGIGKGAIQVPGDGQPIIIMSDAQTTGGYTKIGYVIKEDLDRLSQLKPGDTISFKEISIEKAQDKYLNYMKTFNEIKRQLGTRRNTSYYRISVDGKQYDVAVEEI